QARLLEPAERSEQLEVETSTGDRRQRDDVSRVSTKLRGASLDGVIDAARHAQFTDRLTGPAALGLKDVTRPDQRAQALLDEEGVALGQTVEQVQELGAPGPRLLKDRPQHRVELVARQALQPQFDAQAFAVERRQQSAQIVVDLVAAIGEHQQE